MDSNRHSMTNTPPLRRTLVAVVVVAIALMTITGALAPVVAAQSDGPPPIPAAYYGAIEIDGEPADTGVTIEAEIDGEVRGSITVEESGTFGGPAADDPKLNVAGEGGDDGAAVTFYVEGSNFDRTVVEITDPDPITWESGDIQEVQLTASVDTITPSSPSPTPAAGPDPDPDQDPDDDTDVIDDPDEISELVDVPDDIEPERAERAEIAVSEATGQAEVLFSEESAVESIAFEDDDVEGEVTVAEYASESETTGASPGSSVSVVQISVPEAVRERGGTIRTGISMDRLEERDVEPQHVRLNRFTDDEWQGLETELVDETDERVVVEAETPGFSFFSTSGVSEPEPVIDLQPAAADVGEAVELDGTDSSDRYGEIVSYEWALDGSVVGEDDRTSVEPDEGMYDVSLTVTNDAGESATATETLTVGDPDPDDIDPDADPDPDEPGEEYEVTITVTDDDGGSIAGATVTIDDQELTSDDDGVVTAHLPNGTYTVDIDADGYESVTDDVTVAGGAESLSPTLPAADGLSTTAIVAIIIAVIGIIAIGAYAYRQVQ